MPTVKKQKKQKTKTNSIAVDGLQPKLKIIHEKSAMDSDSDCNAKKRQLSPRGSSVGKLRIIRENTVDSENDCKHELRCIKQHIYIYIYIWRERD